MESLKNTLAVAALLLVTLQSCIWILTPRSEGAIVASYFKAWGRTGGLLMNFFGIQPGRDQKLVLFTWALVPVCVFGLVVLSPAISRLMAM